MKRFRRLLPCAFAVLLLAHPEVAGLAAQGLLTVPILPTQDGPEGDDGVYLVTFLAGTPAAVRASVIQNSQAALRRSFAGLNAASVRIPDTAVLARLRNDPRVLAVVPNRIFSLAVQPPTAQRGGRGGGSPPKAPANLEASEVSGSGVLLTWSDRSKNEDGFRVEHCPGAGCANFTLLGQAGPDAASYSHPGPDPGSVHRYRVAAFSSGGSAYSNVAEVSLQPPASPDLPPASPADLTAWPDSGRILLAWVDRSGDESGFELERCLGEIGACFGTDFVRIASPSPDVESYSYSGTAGATYTFRVRAVNAAGTSAYSNVAEAMLPETGQGDQIVPSGVRRIGAEPGNLTVTGAGIGVAVVDTGLDFNHPDLGLTPEVPGVNAFSFFSPSCQDLHGHGTHVAGIIGARDNGVDVVGVAPEVTLYCVSVFENTPEGVTATDESLVAGLEWIAENAGRLTPPIRVVNMSLGRAWTPDDNDQNHPLRAAVRALRESGIAIAVAAGNAPSREVTQMVPAGYPEALAVASTTALAGSNGYDSSRGPCPEYAAIGRDTASWFTTDGPWSGGRGVTVSAPGEEREDLFSEFGNCYLQPVGILSTALGGGTLRLYGTSMASPHLAGVLALMWEKELSYGLGLDPEVARSRIRSGVARTGTAPLDSSVSEYSFDGEREGVLWAPAALWEAPPPLPDQAPVVSIARPLAGSVFEPGGVITFEATATDPEQGSVGHLLAWTSSRDGFVGTGGSLSSSLSTGSHLISASVTDAGGNVTTRSVSITVGSTQGTVVELSSLAWTGGGSQLGATLGFATELGNAVSGAQVAGRLIEWITTGREWVFSGTTDSLGRLQLQISNAPSGCYRVELESVAAPGLIWPGTTPANYHCR